MKFYISIFLGVIPLFLYAQDSLEVGLDAVSVTANINPTTYVKTARSVAVIDAKTIEKSPVRSLDGILQYAINVDVRSRSPQGVQSDVSIRGGHFDQTLIMLDGIKLNDPQTGHHSMNLPVPIEMIERIEVVQGGASRVFGPAAFAGIIHIITKKSITENVRLNLSGGQHGLLRTAISSGFSNDNFKALANVELIRSEGYTYNTAFEKLNTHFQLQKTLPRGLVSVQGGLMYNNFGASNFYFASFYDQYEEVDAGLLAVRLETAHSNKFSSVGIASYRRHNDLYDFNNYRFSDISRVNFHQTDVYAAEWKGRYLSAAGATSFGLELRQEGVVSNRLGVDLEEPKAVNNYDVLYTKGLKRNNFSLFAEQQKNLKNLFVSGGALLNFNSQFGTELYPGIDLSYQFENKASVYASVNRSLRFPTFTELYLNTSTVVGNPELESEEAVFYEIGYKKVGKQSNLSLATFYKNGTQAIDRIKRPELPRPTMENISGVNFIGIEGNYAHNFRGVVKRIDFNYAFLDANKSEDGFQSFYTLNYLSHKLSVGMLIELEKNLTLQTWYTHKQRRGSYQFTSADPVVAYEPVNLLDIRLNFSRGKFNAFLDVNNLMDANYYEFGFVEQPRRWLSIGGSIGF